MRGIDALAAACAPQETITPNAGYATLTEDQCRKIAGMVLEQLQNAAQPPAEPETVQEPAPTEEVLDNAESESGEVG